MRAGRWPQDDRADVATAGCRIEKATARAMACGSIASGLNAAMAKRGIAALAPGSVMVEANSERVTPGEITTISMSSWSWRKPSEIVRTANFTALDGAARPVVAQPAYRRLNPRHDRGLNRCAIQAPYRLCEDVGIVQNSSQPASLARPFATFRAAGRGAEAEGWAFGVESWGACALVCTKAASASWRRRAGSEAVGAGGR